MRLPILLLLLLLCTLSVSVEGGKKRGKKKPSPASGSQEASGGGEGKSKGEGGGVPGPQAPLVDVPDSGPLHMAAAQGDAEEVANLLSSGSPAGGNHTGLPHGPTPLFLAAGGCHTAVAKLLLQTGVAFPEARAKNGSNALHRVAEVNCSNVDVWESLVEGGVPVDAPDVFNRRPLHEAAAANHAAAVTLLIRTGRVNISAVDGNNFSSLLHAVRLGAYEAVDALLAEGASAVEKGPTGGDALHTAAYEGRVEMASRLLEAGASISGADAQGFTPVLWAARQGHLPMLQFLVGKGGDLRVEGPSSRTPMHFAAQFGAQGVVDYLLEQGVAPGGGDAKGVTPLIYATRGGHTGIVRSLLQASAPFTPKDSSGGNALHYAAFEGRPEVLKVLLAAGASPNAVTEDGQTPLVSLQCKKPAAG